MLVFLMVCGGLVANAQNLPHFSHYVFNPFYFNPGAAGQFNRVQIQSTLRSQYTGYNAPGQPGGGVFSSAFSLDMPFEKLKGGLGVQFSNQNISNAQSQSELTLAYSYHKRINSNIIGVGVGVGVRNLNLKGEDFIQRDPDDPFIPAANMSSMAPQLNIGVYLINPSYQIGLSTKNVLESSYDIGGTGGAFTEKRQYYLTGRYDYGVTYTLDISPMFLVRSDLITTSAEVGLMATYNQRFWFGASYRHQDAGSALVGANLLGNSLKLGYAFDFVTFGQEAKSPMSHELFLRYSLTALRMGKKSVVKTPRYSIK